MQQYSRNSIAALLALSALMASASFFFSRPAGGDEIPSSLNDREFWQAVASLSEPGGQFQDQLMSNEDSAQHIIPALKKRIKPNGIYLGVGTEQNFTYIASIRPKLSFIIDIRRGNLLEHLMYKAIFELSADRADFISRLFSRKRPAGLNAKSAVGALFEAYRPGESDPGLYEENLQAIRNCLIKKHGFPLPEEDLASIAGMLKTLSAAGPQKLTGQGDKNISYARMMEMTDLAGRNHNYLASEDNFRIIRDLEKRNLVIPVVGDFAGNKAVSAVGQYLKDRGAAVGVFYVSNVERYLFDQNRVQQFYANVASLPLDSSSLFIRSVTVDISRRLAIPIPDGSADWRTFLFRIERDLGNFAEGRIRTYPDVFKDREE